MKMDIAKRRISWWRSHVGEAEIQKVRESISNEHISQGPVTEEFEAKFAKALNVPFAVATSSGSVALLMTMMAAGIKPEDEVIIPNRTWVATANAPLILGAKVVLVDVLPDAPIMDCSQVRNKITSRTKAIIPVHLNGHSVNMEEIHKIAKEYDLFAVEDACQALFSKNSEGLLGTQSDTGCFSLGVTKLITTGLGGVITTRNKDTYEKLKLIRTNGTASNINPEYKLVGCNFKFSDILASMGIVQLSQVKEKILHIKKVYARYYEAIKSLPYLKMIEVNVSHGELPLYVEILCKERQKLIKFLNSKDIYPRPALPNLDTVPYLANKEIFPNSIIFAEQGLFLPCGSAQPIENVDYVIKVLNDFGGIQ